MKPFLYEIDKHKVKNNTMKLIASLILPLAVIVISVASYLDRKQFVEFRDHLQFTMQSMSSALEVQTKQLQDFQTRLGKLDDRLTQVEKELAKGKGKDF